MLRIHSIPKLREPVLLCAFGGWADAASAGTSALRYLLLKREGRRVGDFDPDSVFVYTQTRPLTLLSSQRGRRLEWPELAFTAIEVPEEPHDLVVLTGPEPDLRWRQCVRAVGEFASQVGVSQVITFGAFLAQVHYAGVPAVMGISLDPRLRIRLRQLGLAESNYQGPTGFVTAVLREVADRGIPASSLWVAAPSYLGGMSNPKLAAALLRMAEKLAGQSLWCEELEAAGRDTERRIEEALRSRPDLVSFLERVGGQSPEPPFDPQETDEKEPELPTAEEVLNDLEEHLRRLRGETDQDDSG